MAGLIQFYRLRGKTAMGQLGSSTIWKKYVGGGGSLRGFPNLNASCWVSRGEGSRLTKHSPSLALKQTRKPVWVFLFVYPVFLVDSCSFVIEFNGSFVFSQEKSMARINKNTPYEKLTQLHRCMLDRYSCNLRKRRTPVGQGGLTFPYSIKKFRWSLACSVAVYFLCLS